MADVTTNHKPRPRRLTVMGLLLAGTLLCAWSAWWLTGGGHARQANLIDLVSPGQAAGFNVLLITLDTTRPDHLGCYGDDRAHTPTIDALADHGVRFDDAVTCVPITLPSHCAIMTGKYPPTLGVRANGINQLSPEHQTLAELLRRHGYKTAAFIGSFVLDKRFGVDQGFDTYNFDLPSAATRRPFALENERKAADVATAAIRWIRRQSNDNPFFVWTHFFDPHYPYNSPLGDLPQFADRPYDAEIAYVDTQLARLIKALRERQLADRTLIVLTTDHGESLYEHNEPGHAVFVYDSTIQAALILSCPGLFDRAWRVSDRIVGTVDILPTLCDLLGVHAPTGLDGVSLLEDPPPRDRAMYIESYYPKVTLACSPLVGLRRHHDKYILAPRPEYYDLGTDPDELNPLPVTGSAARALRSRLDAMLARWSTGTDVPAARQLTPDEIRKLEALGYLQPADTEVDESCDPKDRVTLINRMSEALDLTARNRLEQALPIVEQLIGEAPGWVAPVRQAASIYLRLSQPHEAERVLADYARINPDPEMLVRLARVYVTLKQWDDCDRTLRAAEALDPHLGAVYVVRGDALYARDQFSRAAEAYQQAAQLDPIRVGPEAKRKLAEARRRLTP